MRDEIIGHHDVIDFIARLIRSGRLPHALLFSGRKGIGKYKVATYAAMMYLCENKNACGVCLPCRHFRKGVNENFITVAVPEDKKSISIDDIRALREWVFMASGEGKGKVAIIDDAHLMTTEAANAFLKTLEEPPEGNVFILVTPAPYKLLPTIVSRCLHVRFKPLSEDEINCICDRLGIKGKTREIVNMSGSLRYAFIDEEKIRKAEMFVKAIEEKNYSVLLETEDLKDEVLMEIILFMLRYKVNMRLRGGSKRDIVKHRELVTVERLFYSSNLSYISLYEYLMLKVG